MTNRRTGRGAAPSLPCTSCGGSPMTRIPPVGKARAKWASPLPLTQAAEAPGIGNWPGAMGIAWLWAGSRRFSFPTSVKMDCIWSSVTASWETDWGQKSGLPNCKVFHISLCKRYPHRSLFWAQWFLLVSWDNLQLNDHPQKQNWNFQSYTSCPTNT